MARQAKHCLLVVDDEPNLVQSVKDLLRREYRVLGATRASDGLRIMEQEQVHIVMTDQRMPEMTGVEFLQHLREHFPDAIRLLFTAYADLNTVTEAINQGNVYRYIAKPWSEDELRTVLKQAEDHYDLQEERRRLVSEIQEKNQQLEQANAELRQANDLKRAFIRVASHELRTPLTIVLGMAELAYQQPQIPPPLSDLIAQVYQGSQRLNDRVDQMVKLLMAERFERPLRPRVVDVAELARATAAAVAQFVTQRRQTLDIDLAADLGTIHAEPDKLHDSLVQLLVNAIKFTPDGGRLCLRGRRTEDGGVELAVSDTGQGMDEATLARVFDPFFTRFDVSRHSSGVCEFDRRGLGLGLAMVKAFVEMHGGVVRAQSAIDEGATFTIVLPPNVESAKPMDWAV